MGIKHLEKLLLDSILLDCCSDEEDISYELSEETSDDNISDVFDCGCCDDCSCDDNIECENCNCECCCETISSEIISSDAISSEFISNDMNNFNINIIEDNMNEKKVRITLEINVKLNEKVCIDVDINRYTYLKIAEELFKL
jgi:hypothetical protein